MKLDYTITLETSETHDDNETVVTSVNACGVRGADWDMLGGSLACVLSDCGRPASILSHAIVSLSSVVPFGPEEEKRFRVLRDAAEAYAAYWTRYDIKAKGGAA